jgi:hypothetical protein
MAGFWDNCLCCLPSIEVWLNDSAPRSRWPPPTGLPNQTTSYLGFAPRYFNNDMPQQQLRQPYATGEQFDINQADETIAGIGVLVPYPEYPCLFIYPLVDQVPDIQTINGIIPKLTYNSQFYEHGVIEASETSPYSNEVVAIFAVAAKASGGYLVGQTRTFFQRTQGTVSFSNPPIQQYQAKIEVTQLQVGADPTQQINTTTPARTAGTYLIGFGGNVYTAPLQWNATQAAVQAAIQAVAGYGSATVATSGTSPNFTHVVTFTGITGPLPLMSISNNTTDGVGTPGFVGENFVVTELVAGSGSTPEQQQIAITQVPDPRTYVLYWMDQNGFLFFTDPTNPIPFSASASTVQTAIQTIPPLSTVTVSQTGSYPTATLKFTFPGFGGPFNAILPIVYINGIVFAQPVVPPPASAFSLLPPLAGSNDEKWQIVFTGNPSLNLGGYILIQAKWISPYQQLVTTLQLGGSGVALASSFAAQLAAVMEPLVGSPQFVDTVTTAGTSPNFTSITHSIEFKGWTGKIDGLHVVDMTGGPGQCSPFKQQYELVEVPIGTDEVQQIAITGNPSAGTYIINWVHPSGAKLSTVPLNWNASEGDVEAALMQLHNIIALTVTSSGTSPNYTHQVRFRGFNGPLNLMSVTNNTTPGTTSFTVTRITAGMAAAAPTILKTYDPLSDYGEPQDLDFYIPQSFPSGGGSLVSAPNPMPYGNKYYGGLGLIPASSNADETFFWQHLPFAFPANSETVNIIFYTDEVDITVTGTFTVMWTDQQGNNYTIGPVDLGAMMGAVYLAGTEFVELCQAEFASISQGTASGAAGPIGYVPTIPTDTGAPGSNIGFSAQFSITFSDMGLPINPITVMNSTNVPDFDYATDQSGTAGIHYELIIQSTASGFTAGGTYTLQWAETLTPSSGDPIATADWTQAVQWNQSPTATWNLGANQTTSGPSVIASTTYQTDDVFYAAWRFSLPWVPYSTPGAPGLQTLSVLSQTTTDLTFTFRPSIVYPIPRPEVAVINGNYWTIESGGEFVDAPAANKVYWNDCLPIVASDTGGYLAEGDGLAAAPTLKGSGTWTITMQDPSHAPYATAPLQWNASAADIQSAVQALNSVFGMFTVSGNAVETNNGFTKTTTYSIAFIGGDAGVLYLLSVQNVNLIGETVQFLSSVGGVNAEQQLTVSFFGLVGMASGTYQITLFDALGNSGTTAPLAYDALQPAVQAAIQAVSGFSAVTVSSEQNINFTQLIHRITFINMGGPIPEIQVIQNSLNVGYIISMINAGSWGSGQIRLTLQPLVIGTEWCVSSDGMIYTNGTDVLHPPPPIQILTIRFTPTWGTFRVRWKNLLYDEVMTAFLPYNCTQQQLQTALQTMTGLPNLVAIQDSQAIAPNLDYEVVFYGLEFTQHTIDPIFQQTIYPLDVELLDNQTALVPVVFIVSVARAGTDSVQAITITGTPTAGTYTIKWVDPLSNTWTTVPLPYNATQTQVQAAFAAIPAMSTLTVSTIGTSPNFTHTVTFSKLGGPLALMTVNSSTTGGSFTVNYVAQGAYPIQQASAAGQCLNMGGPYSVQTLTIAGSPTSGSYQLTLFDQNGTPYTTTPISVGTNAAGLQNVIRTTGAGDPFINISVTQDQPIFPSGVFGQPAYPVTFTFQFNWVPGPCNLMEITSNTTGATITPAILRQGATNVGYNISWVDQNSTLQTTALIPWNASPAQIQAALRLLPGLGRVQVTNEFFWQYEGSNVSQVTGTMVVNMIGVGANPNVIRINSDPIQTLTITGTPTAGTYTISIVDPNGNTQTTAPLPYNATQSQVQSAIAALPNFSTVTVASTGTGPNYVHQITFVNLPGPFSLMTVDNSLTSGGTFTPAIVQQGIPGQAQVLAQQTNFNQQGSLIKIDPDFNVQWATPTLTAFAAILIQPGGNQVYTLTSNNPGSGQQLTSEVFDSEAGTLQKHNFQISNEMNGNIGSAVALTPDGRAALAG